MACARRHPRRSTSSRRSCGSGSRRCPRRCLHAMPRRFSSRRGAAPATAGRGRPRRRRVLGGVHVDASCRAATRADSRSRSRTRSTWRRCGTTCVSACSSQRSGTATRASRRSRCSRSLVSSTRPASSCRRRAGTSPPSPRAASSARRGLWSWCTARSACRCRWSSAARAGRRERITASIAELPGGWGFFEFDLDALFAAAARGGRVHGRDHVPRRQAGPRVQRRRVGRSCRPDRSGPRGSRSGAARPAGVRRLPRRAGRRGQEVGRARRVPSSRPSARSPTRTRRSCASESSPRSPSGSAPSSARNPSWKSDPGLRT